jgi:hypothetical protein
LEGFRLAILRDLEWQAAARKARDVGLNSDSAKAENVAGRLSGITQRNNSNE